jgi:hypothetical protein
MTVSLKNLLDLGGKMLLTNCIRHSVVRQQVQHQPLHLIQLQPCNINHGPAGRWHCASAVLSCGCILGSINTLDDVTKGRHYIALW